MLSEPRMEVVGTRNMTWYTIYMYIQVEPHLAAATSLIKRYNFVFLMPQLRIYLDITFLSSL